MWALIGSSLLLIATIQGAPSSVKILGGTPAVKGQFPYQLALFDNLNLYMCGASIIDPLWGLTAAHCVYDDTNKMNEAEFHVASGTIWLNESATHSVDIDRVIIHEQYDYLSNINDIALLRFASPLNLSDTVQAIELETNEIEPKSSLYLSGWGAYADIPDPYIITKSEILLWATLESQSVEKCNSLFSNPLDPGQMCTLTDDCIGAFTGDSGSPLVSLEKTLVGIVSWGEDCYMYRKPDVFTKVSAYVDWIHTHIKN